METKYLLSLHLYRSFSGRRQGVDKHFQNRQLNAVYEMLSELGVELLNGYQKFVGEQLFILKENGVHHFQNLHLMLNDLFFDGEINRGRIASTLLLASMFYTNDIATACEVNTRIELFYQQKQISTWLSNDCQLFEDQRIARLLTRLSNECQHYENRSVPRLLMRLFVSSLKYMYLSTDLLKV